eukprot:9297773-Alexandrium_andersonii.AAC.1
MCVTNAKVEVGRHRRVCNVDSASSASSRLKQFRSVSSGSPPGARRKMLQPTWDLQNTALNA